MPALTFPDTLTPPPPPAESDGGGDGRKKITAWFTRRSVAAIERLHRRSGDTQTDVLNKGVQFYAEVKDLVDRGGAVYLREPGAKRAERVNPF
jgi:hypothetical protein